MQGLDKVIASLEAGQQKQMLSDETFVRQQRILDELAPRLWSELRRTFQSECKSYPKYLTFEVQPETCAYIRCSKGNRLETKYLPQSKTIEFRIGDTRGQYFIGLDEKNRAAIHDMDGTVYPQNHLVETLLKFVLESA